MGASATLLACLLALSMRTRAAVHTEAPHPAMGTAAAEHTVQRQAPVGAATAVAALLPPPPVGAWAALTTEAAKNAMRAA
mmetsp:Transcript_54219/g.117202  ORF Transcript_54219/g.117202 Transcript_54219/m.117202 type:complete len:80 (-) Transcript_54219:832-1071(-)